MRWERRKAFNSSVTDFSPKGLIKKLAYWVKRAKTYTPSVFASAAKQPRTLALILLSLKNYFFSRLPAGETKS